MKGQRLIPLVVVAVGLLAYHNSFTGEFIRDDGASILDNPTIRHLWPIWQCLSPPQRGGLTVEGRPVINLSLAINRALGGYNVWGYHALNLAVHIFAGLTLLGIVRRTLLQPALRDRFGAVANELALATAVLWTVHPLQTESVTYIIQRAESIMGLFYLLTLYCFIRGTESPRHCLWYSLSVTACALGMASKEVMAGAPLMILLYDRAFLSDSFREAWRRRWPLYLGLIVTWILLGYLAILTISNALRNAENIRLTWWQYLATQPGVILYYLRLSVWPSPLTMDRAWPIAKTWMSILPPAVVVSTLVAATVWAWRRNPVWGFVGAWFFVTLAPSSSIIPAHDPIYEHRMYLSLAAVVSLGVMGLYSVMGRRSVVVFILIALGCGFLTWQRNREYHNDITLRFDTVAKFPKDPLAHFNLGVALAKAHRNQEAIGSYQQALRLNPGIAGAHYSLGVALFEAGKFEDAIRQYAEALRLNPGFAEAQHNWGLALVRLDRLPEAMGHWEEALRIKPDFAEAHCNLGVALARAGRLQEAIAHYEQAMQLKPDFSAAHYNFGVALFEAGQVEDATRHYAEALRLNPNYAEAQYNWGLALVRLNRVPEAIRHWEEAVRIKPDYAEPHYNLGAALTRAGRLQEAIGHWEQALQIKPDYAEAHSNLGVALFAVGRIEDASHHYTEALRLNPEYVEAQSGLGWLLATRPSTEGGDPARAVVLAQSACALTDNNVAAHLDVLAAAYAAAGRFNDAIATAQKAIELARTAGQSELAGDIEARLRLYRDGRPYRRPVDPSRP